MQFAHTALTSYFTKADSAGNHHVSFVFLDMCVDQEASTPLELRYIHAGTPTLHIRAHTHARAPNVVPSVFPISLTQTYFSIF